MEPKDREKQVFTANLMPARGSWLELEIDKKGKVFVRIDRKRKLPVTVLLRAMTYNPETDASIDETLEDIERLDQELLELFGNSLYIRNTIESDPENTKTKKGALIELFKKQRPGEPPSVDAAYALMQQLFFDPKRYDLTRVGRYKLNSRLGLDIDLDTRVLTHDDIHALVKELVLLPKLLGLPEEPEVEIKDYAAEAASMPREPVADHLDEYEHFGNRRLRTVGELIQEAFRIGLIGSLSSYAEISEHGFVTTPYRVVKDGAVTDEIVHLDANQEEDKLIAQANSPMDEKAGKLKGPDVLCRTLAGQYVTVAPKDV